MKRIVCICLFIISNILGVFANNPKVNSLNIRGNKKLKTTVIKKLCELKQGEALDSNLMELDIRRLKRLPAVSHAYYKVDSLFNVQYWVEENFTIIPNINIYNSTGGKLAFKLGVNEYNFLGRNMNCGIFYQNDNFHSFGIGMRAPNLIAKRFGLGFVIQSLTTLEPIFFDGIEESNYKYNNRSVEITVMYDINYQNVVEIAFSQFEENYNYETGATKADIPQDFSIRKALYKAIYKYNNLDYYYQYISGFRSQLDMQYVKPFKAHYEDFAIGRLDLYYFKRIKKKFNLANRLRLGVATNSNSPFAPFAVDNNINIRGVGNTVGRGTAEIVFNTELRYTILDKKWYIFQGNAFVDAGTWRNPGGSFENFIQHENIKINSGLGIRFINKRIFNAVLRVDYGFGITQYNNANGFVIGIGQFF